MFEFIYYGLYFRIVHLRGGFAARVGIKIILRHREEHVAEAVRHAEVIVHFEHLHEEVAVTRAVDRHLGDVERVGRDCGQTVGRGECIKVFPILAVVRETDYNLCGAEHDVVVLRGIVAALCPAYAELVGQAVWSVNAQVVIVVDRFKTVVARVENGAHVAVDKVGKACPLARRSVPDVSLGVCVELACVGGNRIVVVVNRHVGFKKFCLGGVNQVTQRVDTVAVQGLGYEFLCFGCVHRLHVPFRGVALGVAERAVVGVVPAECVVRVERLRGVVDVDYAACVHEVEVVHGFRLWCGSYLHAAAEVRAA